MNMHAVREHQRIKRTLLEIEKNSLLERDPSLINLPIPIPSIPILGPILTGLVGGEADSTTAAAATTATATATATVTTNAPQTSTSGTSDSGSGENDGGSNNNGNGNGSGSGSNGGSGVNGGSGSSSVDAGSSPTVTVSSVASDSLDPSGTSTPRSSGSGSGSGSGTAVHSSSGTPTITSTDANGSVISGSGTSSASQTTNTIINVDAGAKPATQALVLGSSTSGSGAESTTASGSPLVTVSGKSTSTSTATSSVGSGSSSGGTSGSGTDSGTTLSSSATSHHGLSTTAIAGISAIIGVLLICLIIFFARRRYVARRSERRNRWWTAGSSNASVRTVTSSTRGSGDATVGSGTLTARSSFATNFDHGLTPSNPTFDFEYVSASLGLSPPPMAEVRGGAVSPSPSATLTVTRADLRRSNSAHSAQSDVSDSGAQYLTVHTEYNPNNLSPTGAGPPTPMSVRPFSPSESFAFPKPPRQSDDWTSIASRPQSLAARSHVSLTTPKTPRLPPLFPPALPSSNPFADPGLTDDAHDPFSDSDAAAAAPEFAERETIRRPFVPTLQDELGVQPGDDIHIVEIFDDGWAFVEKFVGDTDTDTVQRGLIPIDCLRDADQSLPSFLADKRVSSSYGYGGLAV